MVHQLGVAAVVVGCAAAVGALGVATVGDALGKWTLLRFERGRNFQRWFFGTLAKARATADEPEGSPQRFPGCWVRLQPHPELLCRGHTGGADHARSHATGEIRSR